jgi:hypothetical protein
VSQVLDAESAKKAGPYLTVRSYVFSADVVALGRNNQGFRRNLFIIDTAGSRPKVVYSRDLSRWGWPLGHALQEEESKQ